MQEVVESNRQSIKPEEQDKICAICQSPMETPARIECCSHQFCFECLKHWGTSCANTCPLCKKRFNAIHYEGPDGKPAEFKVLTRNQGHTGDTGILNLIDDSMDHCYVCGRDTDPEYMMICDLCDYAVAHTYCCGLGRVFPEDWVCRDCESLLAGESSSYAEDEEESDSLLANPLLGQIGRILVMTRGEMHRRYPQ